MNGQDHDEYMELLDLQLDGALSIAENRRLDAHISECSVCRRERELDLRLREILKSQSIAVETDFTDRVMDNLPSTGWEARHPARWWVAVALLAVLSGVAASFFGFGAARISPAPSFLSAFETVLDLLATSLVAGAGLLNASWTGLGLAVRELFSGSPIHVAAIAIAVAGLNFLLWRLIRSTRVQMTAEQRRDSGTRPKASPRRF